MAQCVDYSFARPNPADLAAAGYVGVLRYLANLPNGKVITGDELDTLHRNGLAVGFVWEVGTDWMTWNGAEADRQLTALGAPASVPVYWAVDRDVPDRDYPLVGQMLDGVNSARRRGIYGGSGLVEWCVTNGHATFGWIAGASSWGHGQPAPSAHLHQLVGGAPAGCDVNDVLKDDWGQWPPTGGNDMLDPADPIVIEIRQRLADLEATNTQLKTEDWTKNLGNVRAEIRKIVDDALTAHPPGTPTGTVAVKGGSLEFG